jgi:enoyl-CoA hydratase
MTGGYTEIAYARDGAIARVTFARPEQMNPLTPTSLAEMRHALSRAEADPEVKVVVLSGEGRAFSAGGDLGDPGARTASGVPDGMDVGEYMLAIRQELREWHEDYIRFGELRIPIIAQVQGWALGGGAWLAVAADLTIVSEDAVFGQPEVRQGMPSGVIWALVAGWKPALRYSLTGDRLDAQEALRLGLVNEVVPRAELEARVDELARRIALLPMDAIVLNKQLIRRAMDATGFRDALLLAASESGWLFGAWRRDVDGSFEEAVAERGLTAAVRERDAPFRPEPTDRPKDVG